MFSGAPPLRSSRTRTFRARRREFLADVGADEACPAGDEDSGSRKMFAVKGLPVDRGRVGHRSLEYRVVENFRQGRVRGNVRGRGVGYTKSPECRHANAKNHVEPLTAEGQLRAGSYS